VYRRELLLLLLCAMPGHAGRRKKLDKKSCTTINQRIRRLESKLRLGHSGKQGRKLKRQIRELQLKRYRYCR